jgi:hypothetical protein
LTTRKKSTLASNSDCVTLATKPLPSQTSPFTRSTANTGAGCYLYKVRAQVFEQEEQFGRIVRLTRANGEAFGWDQPRRWLGSNDKRLIFLLEYLAHSWVF